MCITGKCEEKCDNDVASEIFNFLSNIAIMCPWYHTTTSVLHVPCGYHVVTWYVILLGWKLWLVQWIVQYQTRHIDEIVILPLEQWALHSCTGQGGPNELITRLNLHLFPVFLKVGFAFTHFRTIDPTPALRSIDRPRWSKGRCFIVLIKKQEENLRRSVGSIGHTSIPFSHPDQSPKQFGPPCCFFNINVSSCFEYIYIYALLL